MPKDQECVYFAGGCFWGVEYFFSKVDGVTKCNSGFMGGKTLNPSYHQVCYEDTGHIEVVEVCYDLKKINFQDLCKLFFEIHDFSQFNGQGPDIGSQYISAIFVNNNQEIEANKIISFLKNKNFAVATKIFNIEEKPCKFWIAEQYHQGYYKKNNKTPYCHFRRKIF